MAKDPQLTVLADSEAALVSEKGELKLILPPNFTRSPEDVSDEIALLILCFMRFHEDPDFFREMSDWFDEQPDREVNELPRHH